MKTVYVIEWKNELMESFELYESPNDANERRRQLANDSFFDTVLCYRKELKDKVPEHHKA